MKNKKEPIQDNQIIAPTPMPSVMADDFARYAKAVLSERAIPDVRDGLKPVQRRIIYGMYKEGNTFDKPTRKSATTVGYVMGNFHPHGDSSIYDALVRLSQDWKMEAPLVAFQGNNGSIDDDPAAASRYTEAKLAKISNLLVDDIDKNTVPMVLNFSDELLEPTVLPARFPNLLVNGAQGIAVGAATLIPTHNLGEVIDASVYAVEHKRATVADLRQFILGPDFPTGGLIDQPEELNKLYETGSASFYIHATCQIDQTKNQIVITDIPYGVIKSAFVAALDKFKDDNHIDNILEVRDESTADVRIAIDIKEGQDPAPILSFLRSKGVLRTTFAANMLAIDKGHPKTMNLLEIIRAYLDHQVDVITRRSKFDLDKDTKRLEVVEGLIKAVDIIDPLIQIIKKSKGKQEAKDNIIKAFAFTPDQAEAIVMLNLYKISSLDYQGYVDEKKSLTDEISELNRLLSDRDYLDRHIVNDLKAVKKEYAIPRKTQILDGKIKTIEVDQTSLIAKEDCYVVLTSDGYIKRTNVRSYQASTNGNIEADLPALKPGDGIRLLQKCSTHDGILAFLGTGTYIYLPVYQLPELKWKEEGKHLNVLVKNLTGADQVVSAFVITTFEPLVYLALLTKEGKIKRCKLADFTQVKLTSRPLRAIGLSKDDSLIKVCLTTGNSDLVICQENGLVCRYNENEVPVVSLGAAGVKAMNLGKGNPPVSYLLSLAPDEHVKLLILADMGAVRAVMSTNLDVLPRLSSKQAIVKIFKSNPMAIVTLYKAEITRGDEQKIVAYTDRRDFVIDIKSLETVLPGSGMKANLDLESGELLKGVHEEGSQIDEHVRVEKPLIVESVKPKDESGAKQMSLFDLFEQDEGGEDPSSSSSAS
ncbi:MAG: DNA topoisomerase 4 subunit A [Bacilli bacterium]|jgi:topoisomerase-4 subunit A|nr:DNA topoisomerase 4 subunit A [Bacilli bacterium]